MNIKYSKKYKIKTKLATCYSAISALEAMMEFWMCSADDIKLQEVHPNLYSILLRGREMEPVLWFQDKRVGGSMVRVFHFCTVE